MTKQELLLTPIWNYKQVMAYTGWKKSKAYEVMKICKEKFGGAVRFNDHAVKRDSVLAYMGSDVEREAYIIKTLGDKDYEKNR